MDCSGYGRNSTGQNVLRTELTVLRLTRSVRELRIVKTPLKNMRTWVNICQNDGREMEGSRVTSFDGLR